MRSSEYYQSQLAIASIIPLTIMKQLTIATSFVLLYLSISHTSAYRILGLFPHPGPSHFQYFHPLLRGLAKAGHDVIVVSYFPDKNTPKNYTDLTLVGNSSLNTIDVTMMEKKSFVGNFIEYYRVFQWGLQSCEDCLRSPVIQKVLNAKPYDVVLVEQFNTACMMGITHFLKAPVIGMRSSVLMAWEYKKHGVPYTPSHNPFNLYGLENKLGFLQRIADFLIFHGMNAMIDLVFPQRTNALVKKYLGDGIPDVTQLANEVSLVFVNQHFSATGVRSIPPNVIEVGGLHIPDEPKPMDANLKRILDAAKKGAIYISWGSQVRTETLPEAKREGIVRAIARLEQQVLWKWENKTIPNSPTNLHIQKWMPQQEILCHSNIKVFVSHGGLLGTSEANYCGVPLVIVPLFGDQFINAATLKERGVATVVKYADITEETIYNAIKEMLKPEIYQNAKELSYAYTNRPMKPLETAMWWVEHVIKTKGRTLAKSNISQTPWHVYHSVDVYLFLYSIVFSFILLNIYVIKSLCLRRNKTMEAKKDKLKGN